MDGNSDPRPSAPNEMDDMNRIKMNEANSTDILKMNKSQNPEIIDLHHLNPALTEIPLIDYSKVRELYLFRNKISVIDFPPSPTVSKESEYKDKEHEESQYQEMEILDLSDNKVKEATDLSKLKNLRTLDLSFNLLESVPDSHWLPSNISELYLHCNDICDSYEACRSCESNSISSNNSINSNSNTSERREYVIDSPTLKKLDLASNSLHHIPTLLTPLLEELYISSNHLVSLPGELKNLENLRILGVENNHFTHLDCADLPVSIDSLILSDNSGLVEIRNVHLLENLRYLDVEHTRICEGDRLFGDLKGVEVLYKPVVD